MLTVSWTWALHLSRTCCVELRRNPWVGLNPWGLELNPLGSEFLCKASCILLKKNYNWCKRMQSCVNHAWWWSQLCQEMSSLQVEDQRLGREYASWNNLTVERRWCLGTLRDNKIKIPEDDILQSYLVNWCCSCPELSSWVVCWSEEPWPRVLLLHLPFHCHWCQAPGRRYTMTVISSEIFYTIPECID